MLQDENRDERESDDREDLRLTIGGDRAAFNRIVARHQASVFRLARMMTSTTAAAEDVLQETFISAYRHAERFRGDSSVRTWLMSIARNAAHRAHRRRVGEPAAHVPLHELGEGAGWGANDTPENRAEDSERREALRTALSTLSEEDRSVIVLRDLEGMTGPEAAAVLELPLATMKTRLHRARLRLMAELKRGGVYGS